MVDFVHYTDEVRGACLEALREHILMGYEEEWPLLLNNGQRLHFLSTRKGTIGVRSDEYKKMMEELRGILMSDARRILFVCGVEATGFKPYEPPKCQYNFAD